MLPSPTLSFLVSCLHRRPGDVTYFPFPATTCEDTQCLRQPDCPPGARPVTTVCSLRRFLDVPGHLQSAHGADPHFSPTRVLASLPSLASPSVHAPKRGPVLYPLSSSTSPPISKLHAVT